MGERQDDGGIHMLPLTHETLAQYVGTSREIVTHYMNRLRREGYVLYTRKSIVLYCEALRESASSARPKHVHPLTLAALIGAATVRKRFDVPTVAR